MAFEATVVGPLVDSTGDLDDAQTLRERAEADGYLFFRGLLPERAVLDVRGDLLEVLQRDGLLDAEQPLLTGAVDDEAINRVPDEEIRTDIGVPALTYVRMQQVQRMHALPHHPALVSLYERLFDEPVFVHPRHIVRSMTSHRALRPTPPHQDFPLVQGSQNTWTCWFPLGDCPMALGSLSILRGSHRSGYVPIQLAPGAGGIGAQLCEGEDEWLAADFSAGDVLTFPSLTVHRALPSQSPRRVRLSMDIRFQPASEPIEARSLTNHSDHDWEEIYASWPTTDLQYYWRENAPRLSPWDSSLVQPGRRIC